MKKFATKNESNCKIIEELQQLPKYRIQVNTKWDAWNFGSINDFLLGQKLAKGGQAEIFEVENCCTKKTNPYYVHIIFKEGYLVRALQHRWPQVILEYGSLI